MRTGTYCADVTMGVEYTWDSILACSPTATQTGWTSGGGGFVLTAGMCPAGPSSSPSSPPPPPPSSPWHFAPRGATACDYGVGPTQAECEAAVTSLAAMFGAAPARILQLGSGGTCIDSGWGSVPLGCSAQTADWSPTADWSAHFKSSGVNCNNGDFTLVCSTPLPRRRATRGRGARTLSGAGAPSFRDWVSRGARSLTCCR